MDGELHVDPAGACPTKGPLCVQLWGMLQLCLLYTSPLAGSDALQATPGTVAGSTAALQSGYPTAYVIELDPAGTKAVLAIVGFGGSQLALDAQGNIYAAGAFEDPLAPTTPGAFQPNATATSCITGLFFEAPCAYPVSYTHLDVYKRQVRRVRADSDLARADAAKALQERQRRRGGVDPGSGRQRDHRSRIWPGGCLLYTSRCV